MFETYESVLEYWFPIRRAYYERRIARQRDLLSLWIKYYENIIKYIQEHDATGFSITKLTVDAAIQYLKDHGYLAINYAALTSSEMKFEPNPSKIVFEDPTYDYILNIRERDITCDGRSRFQASLNKKVAELAQLNEDSAIGPGAPFIGARIWLRELQALETAIEYGRATHWEYDNFGRYEFQSGI